MKQGVLLPSRVRLLLSKGHSCYRPRRTGERKRKSVRGCIVASDMSVLSVTIVKQGEQDLPGLTDTTVPKRLGPKRANNIRKFFVRNSFLTSACGKLSYTTFGIFGNMWRQEHSELLVHFVL